jgi:hypothetical protein
MTAVIRTDCKHYSSRETPSGTIEKCRMDMAQVIPFDCPDQCIFFEPRGVSDTGWIVDPKKRPDDND